MCRSEHKKAIQKQCRKAYRQRKNSVKKRTGSAKTVQKSVQANVEALQKSIQAVQKQYNCSAVCREDGKKAAGTKPNGYAARRMIFGRFLCHRKKFVTLTQKSGLV